MMKGITLTFSGLYCGNPACGVPLYVELMAGPDHEACFDCDPEQFREGWSPLIAEAFAEAGRPLESFAELAELFERSGGRLPAYRPEPGEPFFDDRDAPGPDVWPRCTEPCCAGRGDDD